MTSSSQIKDKAVSAFLWAGICVYLCSGYLFLYNRWPSTPTHMCGCVSKNSAHSWNSYMLWKVANDQVIPGQHRQTHEEKGNRETINMCLLQCHQKRNVVGSQHGTQNNTEISPYVWGTQVSAPELSPSFPTPVSTVSGILTPKSPASCLQGSLSRSQPLKSSKEIGSYKWIFLCSGFWFHS